MNREKLEENVYYYKNVIENPKEFIDLINSTEDYDDNDPIVKVVPKWDEWSACSGLMYVYGNKKNLALDSLEELKNASPDQYEKAKTIIETILNGLQSVCKDYAKEKGIEDDVLLQTSIGINRYSAGTTMGGHYDQQEGDTRLKYSLVMYLNDDYEGGEISFTIKDGIMDSIDKPHQDLELSKDTDRVTFYLKPEAGSVLIFPSSSPYNHTAHLVKSGHKYMVPGFWMNKDNHGNV
jgi:hypothetical protein